jgi:predicted unusual protein kinase regulating ubiquinone biosynthesis (AarF/ABC1/UbiB family)
VERNVQSDDEANRFSARASRYARLGVNAGAFAARIGASRLAGAGRSDDARAFTDALGAMKGPMMKVAQLLATIPEALPADYAEQLMSLQSQAPPMGAAFVSRRMQAELGADWRARFAEFDLASAAAASLGQVHRAVTLEGDRVACKLQYPDMASAVEADLTQLNLLFSLRRRMGGAIDTREIAREIGARLREELDYEREAKMARLYAQMLADRPQVRVPRVFPELSTKRLLTLEWLDGAKLLEFEAASGAVRAHLATLLFEAWWRPFLRYGIIHGDPHLGNYSVVATVVGGAQRIEAVNLFDYGCVRIFPPRFVNGTVELYQALKTKNQARTVHAYELWGFGKLSHATIEAMNIWARFLCGPVLDDRVRTVADGVKPGDYGRREIGAVMRALRAQGGELAVPREFVFLDRAAIGLGAAFLRLRAEMNFHRLYESAIEDFTVEGVARNQSEALAAAGITHG